MNPVEITTVDYWNTLAYIVIPVILIALVSFIVIDIIDNKRTQKSREAAGKSANNDTGGQVTSYIFMLFLSAIAIAAVTGISYELRKYDARNDTLDRVDQEADVTILNKKDIDYSNFQTENSSTPIAFKHAGDLYEGFLIAENDTLVIHVPNQPEEERKLVLFGSDTGE